MSDFDENDIVLAPELLEFTENDTSEQLVCIENWSEEHGVFRVKASVSNLFVLGESNGVVESSTAVEFPVSIKGSLPSEFQHLTEIDSTITVELVPWTDEYEDDGVRAFWATRGKTTLKKTIPCVVRRSTLVQDSPTELSRAMTFMESESFSAFHEIEDESSLSPIPEAEEAASIPETPDKAAPVEPAVVQPETVASNAAVGAGPVVSEEPAPIPPAGPTTNMMDEMRSRHETDNNGLKTAAPPSPPKVSRRRSMYDNPMGGSLFDELKEKQEKIAGGELALNHVHTKTPAEKEQERLAALATVPEGGFTNIMDELKHFSYMLNQSTVEATSDPLVENERNRADSENHAKQYAEEMVEKDTRISELNAEIHRLMELHDVELSEAHEQKATRVAVLEKQHETKLASVMAHHEAQLKQSADEQASRTAALTEHYESRIAAMTKQQEEMGGQEELLEQQRVMMEAFTKAKENEIKDTIMHQELKFGAVIRNHEERIAELMQELDDTRREKEEEVVRMTEQHSQKVKGLMNQQAIAISTLSTQLESTMKVQRERVEALTKQLGDLHQRKLAEAASLRQQYDAKLKAYTERCEQITSALQKQVDDLTVRLQRAELEKKVLENSSPSVQLQSYVDAPQQLHSPGMPQMPRSQQSGSVGAPVSPRRPEGQTQAQTSPAPAAAAVQISPVQEYSPPVGNPFLSRPSSGGHSGPSKPHYTTSVRQLQGRRPQRSESTKDILGGNLAPAAAPPARVPNAQAAKKTSPRQPATPVPSAASSVSVAPGSLRFIAGLSNSEDSIYLHNRSMHPVAFKIRVSVKNMFTLPDAGGILMGGEQKALSVIMKASSDYKSVDAIPKAKFLVELVSADDGYSLLGPKSFWESKSPKDILKKQILAEFQMMN